MEKTYLHWNFPNWLTVFFMAAIGMMLWRGAVMLASNYSVGFAGDDDA